MSLSLNTLFVITVIVVAVTLVVNVGIAIAYRHYKKINNIDGDDDKNIPMTAKVLRKLFRNKKPLWMLLLESLTLCLSGFLLVATVTLFDNYKTHGAIYEDEFDLPIVKILENENDLLTDESSLLLNNIKNSNTTLDDYSIILVRFGCKDCNEAAQTLSEYKKEHKSYIVYSRSEIGQMIIDKYGPIKEVPCIIEHGGLPIY